MLPEFSEIDRRPNFYTENFTPFECLWHSPLSVTEVLTNVVHVWRIPTNLLAGQIQELELILSPNEKNRAENYYFEHDKRRFIARRGSLRIILGFYLEIDPGRIKFIYSPKGKPELVPNGNKRKLCFNLSHSNDLALLAVTLDRSVGIDIESIRPNIDAESMVKNFFSPLEYETIISSPQDQRQYIFLNLWTLKEAYLKATGEGIGGLEKVEISIPHGKPPVLHSINGKIQTKRDWSLIQLMPELGYTAGLAVKGSVDHNYCFYNFEV